MLDTMTRICWLDFGGLDRELVPNLLEKASFFVTLTEGSLQVWQSDHYRETIIELLQVDSVPHEPTSKLEMIPADQIDADRRHWCGPLLMDPFYRLMIYSRQSSVKADHLIEAEIEEVAVLLDHSFRRLAGGKSSLAYCVWQTNT